ncbi:hypothetical protein BKA67DRAFT_513436 [Truncatella angustata]|uniref:LCCL domain-containing protein n=1 Tax=Truncatella angustata TaxID=152316 RepID=A0A9P8UTX3_9PEZI|nr:uncharacterized protein BKA67DRAFT_513436 [Truncatella angustata]KAH6658437.1 hypothetical protein BKA67DRAFT_513436 [Truncatella angustata]
MSDRQAKKSPAIVLETERPEASSSESRTESLHPDAPIDQVGHLEVEEDGTVTPRFMQDEGAWKRWKWVPYPVRRFGIAVAKWSSGPKEPTDYKIKPLFPVVQEAPLVLLDKYLPNRRHRIWLFMGYVAIWLLTFCLVMRQGLKASEIESFGTPSDVSCGTTYWVSGNQCGTDGNDCRPFSDGGFAFKCPANCASYKVLNPRAVGDQEVVYTQLIVGGPGSSSNTTNAIYRGDSFICGAGIHAGVISNSKGGCGVVKLIGQQSDFASSTRNGITSTGFTSYFPLSYTFENGIECDSKDVRWPLLAVSVTFTAVLALFTSSAPVFFFSVFVGIFWQVGMASDAPSHTTTAGLFSNILGKFLPAMFCAWVIYDKMGVRRTLKGLTAQVEKTVLWLGGCWVGALTNYTFDFIPIQRLTGHDLDQQPGAKAALAMIIIVLAVVVISQVWFFRQEGRLLKYLRLYALFILTIIIALVLPDLSLRIHHYILALLLLPGTSMQTRPSLLYQGILVGFFINGIARWGFDSVLQTSYALQGDAQLGSPLPTLIEPIVSLASNASSATNATIAAAISTITFNWHSPPAPQFDGISVLVNDVERLRTYFADVDGEDSFTWKRSGTLALNEYFRFAWMQGSSTMDYTKAGVWNADGSWTQMADGPSKVKARSLDGEARLMR